MNYATLSGLSDETVLRLRTFRREHSVLTRSVDDTGRTVVIRYSHFRDAQLIRPDLALSWPIGRSGGRGSTTSEEAAALFRLPAVDRLALEMASNEDMERRAMLGELAVLQAAWKEAEEIDAISDELFADEVFEEFKRQYVVRQAQLEA